MDNMIITIIAFIGSLIPIITVLLKLNAILTELNTTMHMLKEQMTESKEDRHNLHLIINNHETRLVLLEKKEEGV